MATEKIVIATCTFKNNWFNLTDNNGREISVGTVDKKTGGPINQKLKVALESAVAGTEVEMDIRDWQGKLFGNEVKAAGSGGGKSFAPKDRGLELAQTCIQAAATTHSLTKDVTPEKVMETATKYMAWVNAQSTLKTQTTNN